MQRSEEVRVELKYCEYCGALFLRLQQQAVQEQPVPHICPVLADLGVFRCFTSVG